MRDSIDSLILRCRRQISSSLKAMFGVHQSKRLRQAVNPRSRSSYEHSLARSHALDERRIGDDGSDRFAVRNEYGRLDLEEGVGGNNSRVAPPKHCYCISSPPAEPPPRLTLELLPPPRHRLKIKPRGRRQESSDAADRLQQS